MNKKLTMLVIGGIVTASAMGLGFNATVGHAAEKEAVKPAIQCCMMGDNKMGAMDHSAMGDNKMGAMEHGTMGDMMKNGDMQKHCMEMMKSPEMQSMMKEMMKNPEMQSIMKEVMQENNYKHNKKRLGLGQVSFY